MISGIPVPFDFTGFDGLLLDGLSWTLRASVVLALAWGAARLVHRASAASRHLLWLTSLLAVSILPLLTLTLP